MASWASSLIGEDASADASPRRAMPKKLMRAATSKLNLSNTFVKASAAVAETRKLESTLASFLPTGLLEQMHDALEDRRGKNPRVAVNRPGVYVALLLDGPHGLRECPIESSLVEERLRQVFQTLVTTIADGGGETLRFSGSTVLAVWPLRGAEFDTKEEKEKRVADAARAAAACASKLLQLLHGLVLWSDNPASVMKKTTVKRKSRVQQQQQPGSAASSDDDDDDDDGDGGTAGVPAAAAEGGGGGETGGGKRPMLWGGLKTRSSSLVARPTSKLDKLKAQGKEALVQAERTSMSDVIRAANEGRGEEHQHLLRVTASLVFSSSATAMHVGGANRRWEYVVVGQEIGAAQSVLTQVGPGTLLVADALGDAFPALMPLMEIDGWSVLRDGGNSSSSNSSRMLIEGNKATRASLLGDLPQVALRPYVPGPIWSKILAGDPHWISHYSDTRTVTMLMMRCYPPKNAPLYSTVAAFTTAVNKFQSNIYKCMGTFKQAEQKDEGITMVAALGMPPFEFNEVNCSRGALVAALQIHHELIAMGLRSHAAIRCGTVWVGAAGSESRREFVLCGEAVQLTETMLAFTTDQTPILVDGKTSQANKAKFNFQPLALSVRMPNQLKQHALFALDIQRPSIEPKFSSSGGGSSGSSSTGRKGNKRDEEMKKFWAKTPLLGQQVAHWLVQRKRHVKNAALAAGSLSDLAQHLMKECFHELDKDGSGSVSASELLEAIREIDPAPPGGGEGGERSLLARIDKIMADTDIDGDGVLSYEELLHVAACATEEESFIDRTADVSTTTDSLPLLLTAFTTRRLLQRDLGDEFRQSYHDGKPVKPRRRSLLSPIPSRTSTPFQVAAAAARLRRPHSKNRASKVESEGAEIERLHAEVQDIYSEYTTLRSKLGPLNDPSGRLAALLSPRATAHSKGASGGGGGAPKEDALSSLRRPGESPRLARIERAMTSTQRAAAHYHNEPHPPPHPPAQRMMIVPTASSAASWAPPSTMLPPLESPRARSPGGSQPPRNAPTSPRRGWHDADLESQHVERMQRRASMRDHYLRANKGGTKWQKKLRRQVKERLFDSRVKEPNHAKQELRLHAFRAVRDSVAGGPARLLDDELELGHLGNTGLGLGSRPATASGPNDDQLMGAWAVQASGISEEDVARLNESARLAARPPIEKMSRQELLEWLSEPWSDKASFKMVEDILHFHGVSNEFPMRPPMSKPPPEEEEAAKAAEAAAALAEAEAAAKAAAVKKGGGSGKGKASGPALTARKATLGAASKLGGDARPRKDYAAALGPAPAAPSMSAPNTARLGKLLG